MQAVQKRRGRTIAARIRSMVMIPTAALVALWLIITFVLAYDAVFQLLRARATHEMVTPAAVGLVHVMEERSATVAYIERPDNAELEQQMMEARQESDATIGVVIEDLIGFVDIAPGRTGDRIEELYGQYGEINRIRAAVDSGSASRAAVLDYYDALMLAGADVFDAQGRDGNTGESTSSGFTAVYMFRTVDAFARTDAQLQRAFASGELGHEDQHEFTQLVGTYQNLLESNAHYLEGPGQLERYEALMASPEYAALLEMQEEIIHRQIPTETVFDPTTGQQETVQDLTMPVDEEEWRAAYDHTLSELTDLGADEALNSANVTGDYAWSRVFWAVTISLGSAAVIGLASTLARRSSQNLTRRLLRLRDDSIDLAENRLPDIMRRLHEGERVDTGAAMPGLSTSDDEIGDVARAFNSAQRAAVDEAVQQTELRHGVNRVFLNIAHRSQTLVHRQLRLRDKMEREQEDPEQLEQLFKLDHLATRSRRNAENLLILGGEAPGRTWHRPMPLIDVLRGAISESGDYTRVKRERIARVHLNGPAVADVIHLVAELVDNAAMFSPPHTHVRLSSEDVPNGVTIEIEDRGLGMTDGELASANALLSNPPEFDVMRLNEKMRLGLFVVSHLAHRHGIRVHLRSSPYGGVQAIVLLPHELIAGGRPQSSPAEEEDIWEVRAITDRPTPPSSNGAKPVLTPVATPPSDDTTGNEDEGTAARPAPTLAAAPDPVTTDGEADGAAQEGTAADDPGAKGAEDGTTTDSSSDGAEDGGTAPDTAAPAEDLLSSNVNGDDPLPSRTRDTGPTGDGPTPPAPAAARPALPVRDPGATKTAERSSGADVLGTGSTDVVEAGGGRPPLPKRRPQENLAPQLAAESPEDPAGPAAGLGAGTGRVQGGSPDGAERLARLRRNMSAFQKGTDRGRREGKQQTHDTDKDA
ncbi:nitrate- and nitrite sensing domain-containing protein [Nocardiopsis lucentensis]|uniref:nitrate- and nitrite sensing domain-containing protein n=1 Tax=Nocardiopsis lucentensis TaxID=53441 RepID=UPI0003496D1A|nr:nitrate- and nitrite sensing domain-containing protein [Nocardiopsis lucentensis]